MLFFALTNFVVVAVFVAWFVERWLMVGWLSYQKISKASFGFNILIVVVVVALIDVVVVVVIVVVDVVVVAWFVEWWLVGGASYQKFFNHKNIAALPTEQLALQFGQNTQYNTFISDQRQFGQNTQFNIYH